MIYHFRIVSDETKDFIFEMLIDSGALFSDFNAFIQGHLDFDKKEMTSFFLTDSEGNKEIEITLFDMGDSETEQLVMDKVHLEELINNGHQNLLYMFDMYNNRYLYIDLVDTKDGQIDTPKCVLIEGTPPEQFVEDFETQFEKMMEEDLYEENFDINLSEDFDVTFDSDDEDAINYQNSSLEDYY